MIFDYWTIIYTRLYKKRVFRGFVRGRTIFIVIRESVVEAPSFTFLLISGKTVNMSAPQCYSSTGYSKSETSNGMYLLYHSTEYIRLIHACS